MFEVVGSESGVTSLFETAFTDLVFNEAGEAIGIEAQQGESPLLIKAKKGVVLACGGFEYNEEMKLPVARVGHAVQHGRCSDGVSQVRYRLLAHELRDAGNARRRAGYLAR